jgi:hypothetical protein
VIECRAQTGLPRPVVDWYFNGAVLRLSERHMFTQDEQMLVITDTMRSDAGSYRCTLSNDLGKLSKETLLTVGK